MYSRQRAKEAAETEWGPLGWCSVIQGSIEVTTTQDISILPGRTYGENTEHPTTRSDYQGE